MEFTDKNTLKLDKILNELDKFVLRFIRILEKHTDYVIISGYVAILLGRSRATEDVDVFIKLIDKEKFAQLYKELKKNNFWCLNAENIDEVYSYLENGLAIRFADKNTSIPNFEVKIAKRLISLESFRDRITVITQEGNIKISSLERQIAFKRYYLKSDKDLEDAKHLEETFKGNIDRDKIKSYKRLIDHEMA